MSITIPESGLLFGQYNETDVFIMENSTLYKTLGENVKSVEFALCHRNGEITLIEAKSSSPKPGNQIDFDEYTNEINEKFEHSVDLFFSVLVGRLNDIENEMPNRFKQIDYCKVKMRLILVINGHKVDWLGPIKDDLQRKLRRLIKTWRFELTVMNHEMANSYGLVTNG